jgi:hypothetical protein
VKYFKTKTLKEVVESTKSQKFETAKDRRKKYSELSKWINREKNLRFQISFNVIFWIFFLQQMFYPIQNLIPYLCIAPVFFLWYSYS